jgi:Tol biopolymer transport system component
MTINAGSRLGPYEVLSPLGAGGMGEVYKARDTRLERTVAIKVLPQHLSSSPELRQRFEREARAVSQLSHPHICALYDVGREGETDFLVMEYLAGETLAARLVRGPLATGQLLRFGSEIADALDKAHRQGIVHRDLKPGNVMLTKSGVKLLDFGLAKAFPSPSGRGQGEGLTSLPTQAGAAPLTEKGTILGTFQYMAPEQLEGKEADARSDIFAFGAVLYEMATGQKAFSGTSQASLISSIMKEEPEPISAVQPMTPPALDRVVRTCLAKDPDERWQNAGDLKNELKWIAGGSQFGAPAVAAAPVSRLGRWIPAALGAAAGAAVAALVGWALWPGPQSAVRATIHAAVALPAAQTLVLDTNCSVAISPDGRQIAYLARQGDARQLFVRSLSTGDVKALSGTDRARMPFFSPDGRWVGFWSDGKIQKVALAGGAPVPVVSISRPPAGAAWGSDDSIVYPESWGGGLVRVPASGGTATALTKPALKGSDRGHLWPDLLPDGKAVLFTVFTGGSVDDYEIAAQTLATGERKTLIKGGTAGRYVASGHIVYARGGSLFAMTFDEKRLAVSGAPFLVAQDVALNTNGGGEFAVSRSGTLVSVPGGLLQPQRALVWADRKGNLIAASQARRPFGQPAISPDGKRLCATVMAATYDLWMLDLDRDTLTRFSFGKDDGNPIWSPDGRKVAYQSSQAGTYDIWVRPSDGSGSEQRLTKGPDDAPTSWSRDGRWLAFERRHAGGVYSIWLLPLGQPAEPQPYLQGAYSYRAGHISPDGRWMAYTSNESGRTEVYVTTVPEPGGKWQISTEGGEAPLWAPDGREIFYRKERKVLAAGVKLTPAFAVSKPETLFEGEYFGEWTIAPDGRRFLMMKDEGAASVPKHLDLVLGWLDEMKSRAPGGGK